MALFGLDFLSCKMEIMTLAKSLKVKGRDQSLKGASSSACRAMEPCLCGQGNLAGLWGRLFSQTSFLLDLTSESLLLIYMLGQCFPVPFFPMVGSSFSASWTKEEGLVGHS